MDTVTPGVVYLVGTGPGDPGLLTLRGRDRLGRADCVVYDKLVDPRVLDWAPPQAERIYVGKQPGSREHCASQDVINAILIKEASAGRTVVRLKGGDPLLFARGGEEVAALREANIDYEIVPGVTAALGSAATAAIPLTFRNVASAVAFVTGHEDPTKGATLDWQALAKFPGTLVVYMALRRIATVAATLVEHGLDPRTPLTLIEWGGTNRQRTHRSTVGAIAGEKIDLQSPVLAVVGEVCRLADHLEWFERRPLHGRRVLVLRPQAQAQAISERLEELGAQVILQPALAIDPPDDWTPVDRALADIDQFDWLVFSSRNGVAAFLERLFQQNRDLRALGGVRIAAIGPATAAALEEYHLKADILPEQYRAEGLAAVLRNQVAGKRILLARADRGRDVLAVELARAGAAVEAVVVYQQTDVDAPRPEVLELLRKDQIDWVLLSSSNIASVFFRWLDGELKERIRSRPCLVSISPVTSERIRAEGFAVAIEAAEYTLAGMVDALLAKTHRMMAASFGNSPV